MSISTTSANSRPANARPASARRRPARRGARALALLALLPGLLLGAGCEPIKPPEPPVVLEVGPGAIFAAEFKDDSYRWWVVDPSSGAIASSGTDTAGALQIVLDEAAGAYITTPSTTAAPPYTVELTGSVLPGGVFAYLPTATAAFDGLRADDGAAMAAAHAEALSGAADLNATLQADLDEAKARLATQVALAALAAQDAAAACTSPLFDTDDIALIRADAAGPADWRLALDGVPAQLEAETTADRLVADGNALELSTLIPDEAATEADVETCLDLDAEVDLMDRYLIGAYPDAMRDESWTYDGRRGDSGPVDDKDWMARDERFDASVDELEKRGLAIEACVEDAAGDEPEVLWDDITPEPYEAIGADAEAMAALRALEAADCEALMQTSFGAYIDADVIGGELNPAVWAAAEAHALPTLYAIGGEELLSDANVVAPAPSPSGAATARQPIEDSSADACEDTTWVFQINIAGLGLAIGTPFDDVIRGNDDESGFEVLVAGRGDDCVNGRKGHELILGGRDNDELHGGDQHEFIFGGPGDDALYLGEGADYDITLPTTPPMVLNIDIGSVAFGGKGADFISGGDPTFDLTAEDTLGFTDIIFGDGVSAGGAGADVIEGAGGVDLLFGQWGDDEVANHRAGLLELHIPATGEIEETDIDLEFGSLLFGGKGNDQLGGSPSFDLLFGNTGNDAGVAGAGLDLVFGGKDNDTMDGEDGLDLVFGSKGNDTLGGGEGIDLVFGGLGDDIIAGGAGAIDLLFGGSGSDELSGEDGIDMAFGGLGSDLVDGGAGLIDLLFGGAENDTIEGGEGVDLGFGGVGRDEVNGGAGLDLLFGGDETDIVQGQDDVDVLFSNADADWVSGGAGFDLAWSGAGPDAMYGGDDIDVLFTGEDNDCLWGEGGIDLAFLGDGDDWGSGGDALDLLVGGAGNDQLQGDEGTDLVLGGDDDDALNGGIGVDLLFGSKGNDSLWGGDALDMLFSGVGDDCVDGGAGFDIALLADGADTGREVSVGFGSDGDDTLQVDRFGAGGKGDDVAVTSASMGAALFGGEGDDHLTLRYGLAASLAYAGAGNDTLTAPGATAVSASYSTLIMLGGEGDDWLQGSLGRTIAAGGKDNDTLSADPDGGSSNDDRRDYHFGNKGDDSMFGDSDAQRDLLIRGGGNDPAKEWDLWPATSPAWGPAHAVPTVSPCATPAALACDAAKEPPADVGYTG